MAVPVIESVSNAAYVEDTASLVITKPTGLAVGNLMVAIINNNSDDGFGVGSITPPAGWTTITSNVNSLVRLGAYSKIADASDVSASDFTFTNSDTTQSATVGSIFRISTEPSVTNFLAGTDNNQDVTVSISVNQSTNFADTLFIMALVGYSNASSSASLTDYIINGTNPTWAEQRDTILNADRDHSIAIATASISDVRTITSYGATASKTAHDYSGLLLLIHEQVDAQGTNATFAVSPLLNTQNGVVGGQGTNALLAVSPTFPTQNGKSVNQTQWNNQAKPTVSVVHNLNKP